MRPHQWTKNFFVLAALCFGGKLGDRAASFEAVGAFAVFCAIASAIYLINDICDRDADRLHPEKRHRPIALGEVGVGQATAAAVLLGVGGLVAASRLNDLLPYACAYLLLQLAYSFGLKRLFLVDALCVSLGFLIRVHAGGAAITGGIPISPWLSLCALFLALFLVFGKRRAELGVLEEGAAEHRAVLEHYDGPLLDLLLAVVTACTTMAYALYTVLGQGPATAEHMVWTIPFVLYGVGRYLFLVLRQGEGGDPGRAMVRDPAFLLNGLLWVTVVGWILYT